MVYFTVSRKPSGMFYKPLNPASPFLHTSPVKSLRKSHTTFKPMLQQLKEAMLGE